MTTSSIIYGKTIGYHAARILQKNRRATILGITSHGIFLLTETESILFLTNDSYRGPLTINLDPACSLSSDIEIGDIVLLEFDRIIFPNQTIALRENITIWQPPPFPVRIDTTEEIIRRAQSLCSLIHPKEIDSLFRSIFEILMDFTSSVEEKQSAMQAWALSEGEFEKRNILEPFFKNWLGRGEGLTPAGDDYLCGFLLTCHYQSKKQPLNRQEIFRLARKCTTSLSASLIACATEGAADERLLNTLLYLACGIGSPQQIKEELLSYGSSSGVETFAGMLTAIFLA